MRRRVVGGAGRARRARLLAARAPPLDALQREEKAIDSVLGYTPFVRAGAARDTTSR